MIEVKLHIKDALSKVDKAIQQYENRKSMYNAIGFFISEVSDKAFKNERDPTTGRSWQRLSKERVAQRGGSTNPILFWTGFLKSANTLEVGDDMTKLFNPAPYASDTFFGVPTRALPARPFIGVSEADVFQIKSIAEQHLFQPLL
jgi:phage virion morphogenesis protein